LCRASKPRFALRTDADYVKPMLRTNPGIVRIAVPAWSRKVSPTFLQHCKKIEVAASKAGKRVEFWFFPNAVGSLYQGFSRRVQSLLNAKVFPRTNYNDYIKTLNKADIFLSSFPFGATNGIVDAIKQGIPVVNLTGPEVHEANDSHIVKRFEQPDWLTTHSGDEYVAAVIRLVKDNELRVKIGRALLENDPDSKLIAADGADDFATVLRAAYAHHEEIQASEQKTWQFETLSSMVSE
jgi:glycosyltransferase involved in cell wall biosynthesis